MAEGEAMSAGVRPSVFGPPAIDCDVHIAVPSISAIIPYLDDYWQAQFKMRGIERLSLGLTSAPPNAAISGRPDWRPAKGAPGTDLSLLQSAAIEGFGASIAIANCIWGGMVLPSDDMSAAVCRAQNDWIAREWLDREPRLRASIVVPLGNAGLAVEEIERRAGDNRFVQVLMLIGGQDLPGKRGFWPIYEAAERHGLAIGFHAGSSYHHPAMAGYGSYFIEDYVAQAFAFETGLVSLVSEGVFAKYPTLKVVYSESGVAWLPPSLWRFDKTWRGVRAETPWVKLPPSEIVRNNVRLTLQPLDAPDEAGRLERISEHLGSDRVILFSSDFPHWHYEGTAALPLDPSSALARRILFGNAIETYPRIAADLAQPVLR